MQKGKGFILVWLILILFFLAGSLGAKMKDLSEEEQAKLSSQALTKPLFTCVPNATNSTHWVGNVWFTVTNYGFFGSELAQGQLTIAEAGCFLPQSKKVGQLAPSFQFPAGSDMEYLFQGALWIGAIVGSETLTSVGADGWQRINEMYPPDCASTPIGIIERTTRPGTACSDSNAISEQDLIAVYTDTLVSGAYTGQDPFDQRDHRPLGIQVSQRSYAWSYEYAQDFVLIDFVLTNIGTRKISQAYMGIYIDADVWNTNLTSTGYADDITGFKPTVPSPIGDLYPGYADTIKIAWIADNDGDPDPRSNSWGKMSVVAATGTRVVRSPNPDLKVSFNWWVSNGNQPDKDWGPWRDSSRSVWLRANPYGRPGELFPDNVLGTPGGDKSKYFIMSNGEFDNDQMFCGIDYTQDGWLPPPSNAGDLAPGYDTRYLFSFGPFDIGPGDSLPLTVGYIAGDNFHVNPDDYKKNFNVSTPERFYNKLDFTDFAVNAQWAAWVYDNPGVDTDGDGDSGKFIVLPTGERYYFAGDGVPDFKGPPPPTPPDLQIETSTGKVKVKWNGKKTELGRDAFTAKRDFEGYRIYMSTTGLADQYTLLGSYDLIDYKMYTRNPYNGVCKVTEPSLTKDSIRTLYGPYCNPDLFNSCSKTYAYYDPTTQKTVRIYFQPQDWNKGLREIRVYKDYADSVDQGLIQGEIRDDYWEYEFEIVGLEPSQGVYFAVTGFDYGNPQTSLGPLESSKLVNAKLAYPVAGAEELKKSKPKVVVYPNPYKAGSYERFEPNYGTGAYDSRLNFANLPAKCIIRIFTLSGDLVKELEHNKSESDPTAGYESWNLISRNLQAVVSGVYLYSVESAEETQVGKFVIIK
jgi:hypothetical protein